MKKSSILLLVPLAALNLHGMEDGQRTPKRQKPGSTIVARSESNSDNVMLREQLASLKAAVAVCAFSPERDSSIEKVSGATKHGALQRKFGIASVVPVSYQHRNIAIQKLTARIAELQGVEQQADQARSVSQITSMKAAHEFGRIVMSARRAHAELTGLRDDMANGGDLLAQQVRRYARFRLNFDAAENENARNSGFLDILGEGAAHRSDDGSSL